MAQGACEPAILNFSSLQSTSTCPVDVYARETQREAIDMILHTETGIRNATTGTLIYINNLVYKCASIIIIILDGHEWHTFQKCKRPAEPSFVERVPDPLPRSLCFIHDLRRSRASLAVSLKEKPLKSQSFECRPRHGSLPPVDVLPFS